MCGGQRILQTKRYRVTQKIVIYLRTNTHLHITFLVVIIRSLVVHAHFNVHHHRHRHHYREALVDHCVTPLWPRWIQ